MPTKKERLATKQAAIAAKQAAKQAVKTNNTVDNKVSQTNLNAARAVVLNAHRELKQFLSLNTQQDQNRDGYYIGANSTQLNAMWNTLNNKSKNAEKNYNHLYKKLYPSESFDQEAYNCAEEKVSKKNSSELLNIVLDSKTDDNLVLDSLSNHISNKFKTVLARKHPANLFIHFDLPLECRHITKVDESYELDVCDCTRDRNNNLVFSENSVELIRQNLLYLDYTGLAMQLRVQKSEGNVNALGHGFMGGLALCFLARAHENWMDNNLDL